jgi:hypothetical protein
VTGGTSPYEYQWYLDGTVVSGATNATWTFTPASAGYYTVYVNVTDSVGAQATSNSANVTVNIHDVAVTSVTSSKTVVGQGYSLNVTVMAADLGTYAETFNVTIYANTTSIASQNVTLSNGNSINMVFTWNTTGFAYGNYTVSAYIWLAPGETNMANNNCTGGWVIVAGAGDITGSNGVPDGVCDITDVAYVASLFGMTSSKPGWQPNADLNNDGTIDISDVAIVAAYFGKVYPYPPYPLTAR